jgi:hypothetical protein
MAIIVYLHRCATRTGLLLVHLTLPSVTLAASLTIGPGDALAPAVAQLRPGETLTLRGGTYPQPLRSGDVTFPSGTSWDAAVTIQGAPGETVMLVQPVNIQANSDGSPVSYLILDNLHMPTFRVADASHHIRLAHSEVSGDATSVVVITKTTDAVEIVGNDIHGAGIANNPAYPVTVGSYGCYCNGDHMLLDDNTWHDNTGSALNIYLSGGTVSNARIRRNTFVHNAWTDGERNLGLDVVTLAGSNNLFCGNTLQDNTTVNSGSGVSVEYGSDNVVVGNTITGTAGPAITLNDSALNTVVAGNQLSNNQAGIVGAGMASMITTTTLDCGSAAPRPGPLAPPRPSVPAPRNLRLRAVLS